MSIETKSRHRTEAGGNVFLGMAVAARTAR
jgi:hypothetical protein